MDGESQPPRRSPAVFQVGRHEVRITGRLGHWNTSVDGAALPETYQTEAAAWTAGVHEADRLDRAGPR